MNSRYLDEAMARLAEAVAQPVGGSIVISTADACAIGNELRRLQALARGPQQAGGEDAQDAERYRWLRRKIDPDTIYAVIEDDFDLRESQSRDVDAAIDAARLVRDGDPGEG